ncbi:MAG: GNAT family N-acetyltransferase [Candidatus Kapaibacteriota bacterium]
MTHLSMLIHGLDIRPASIDDVSIILDCIKALADYEKLTHEVIATEEALRTTLFGERPAAEVVIGYTENGIPAGFAIFFSNYSTFLAKPGIYLEDLFVKPEFRGKGFGKAMLIYLARIAQERGCGRLEWSVLDWNTPAIDFYQSLGATPMDEWTVFRLTGATLEQLASQS